MAGSRTAAAWIDAWAKEDVDHLRMGIGQIAKHPRRGPETSTDGEFVRFPQNPPHHREAHIEDVPGSPDAVRVRWVEGAVGTQLTMKRKSLGDLKSETGFFPALRAVIGNPTGWTDEPPTGVAFVHTSQPFDPPAVPSGSTRLISPPLEEVARQVHVSPPEPTVLPTNPPEDFVAMMPAPSPRRYPRPRLVPNPGAPPLEDILTGRTLQVDPTSAFLCPRCRQFFKPEEAAFWLNPDSRTLSFAGLLLCGCPDPDDGGSA